jgi:hypothetical protein
VSSTHWPPAPPEAAALRAVTLALVDGTGTGSTGRGSTAQETGAAAVLRTVAATVTLIENRSKGEAKAGESIILALG